MCVRRSIFVTLWFMYTHDHKLRLGPIQRVCDIFQQYNAWVNMDVVTEWSVSCDTLFHEHMKTIVYNLSCT